VNTKLHAVTDENSRPIRFFMIAGEISDCTGEMASGRPGLVLGSFRKQGDKALHPKS
jgi:hypothetical protein